MKLPKPQVFHSSAGEHGRMRPTDREWISSSVLSLSFVDTSLFPSDQTLSCSAKTEAGNEFLVTLQNMAEVLRRALQTSAGRSFKTVLKPFKNHLK